MKFAKMPEEPELPPPPMIEPPEPEPESAATPPSSSPASEDNEADRAEQLSQLQQQVLSGFLSLQCIKRQYSAETNKRCFNEMMCVIVLKGAVSQKVF